MLLSSQLLGLVSSASLAGDFVLADCRLHFLSSCETLHFSLFLNMAFSEMQKLRPQRFFDSLQTQCTNLYDCLDSVHQLVLSKDT